MISLALGFAGACTIIVTGTLLARANWLGFLRYCGEHSIVIYLAFFLPMVIVRVVLLKTGIIPDIGLVSLIDTIAGRDRCAADVVGRETRGLNFLFERPAMFWIAPKQTRPGLQAAE